MRIRATLATVDLGAIRHNLRVVRRLAPGQQICAVVKANAYGHGLLEVGRTLAAAGVDWFAVALVEEGVVLRSAGVRTPILVMGGALEDGFAELVEYDLVPAVSEIAQLQGLARAAGQRVVKLHLKIDTGMTRLGILPAELPAFLDALGHERSLSLDGLFTHFANADLDDHEVNARQLAQLEQARQLLVSRGHTPRCLHIANSAGLLTFPQAQIGMVRPGLLLYGLEPLAKPKERDLVPAMSWTTRPVRLRSVEAGTQVSYGGTWTAPRPSRIATLPVGYADGYPKVLSNRAQVLVRGRRAPIIGAVCMDLCLIDVTDIPEVSRADEVALMGKQGDDAITAYELARWAGTIPYEIICGVSERVPRRYVDETA